MRRHRLLFLIIATVCVGGFFVLWQYRGLLRNAVRDGVTRFTEPLPEAVSYQEVQTLPSPAALVKPVKTSFNGVNIVREQSSSPSPRTDSARNPARSLPREFNLDVPFTSQAPFESWDAPFKETCEEASLLMVDRFYKGGRFTKQGATNAIIELITFERGRLGYYEDTTAEETAAVAREYFGYKNVKVVKGPLTADMIKQEIAQGRPVVLPMAGRLLGNIYFRRPGPYYHMLVVKGYTPTDFITNDPGTKRGHNYRYSYATLLNAIHDFDPTNITDMPQAMIVIYPDK